ncbi:MAG: efflux RND transporter permease subunit [Candidatus Comchoanobacterales bacterium]
MIRYFIQHRLAPHLLFIILILGGLLAALQINIQLLPDRKIPYINIFTQWFGHPANEVDEAATKPMVDGLLKLNFVNNISSQSMANSSSITLKIPEEDQNLDRLIEVQESINQTNLPSSAKLYVQAPQPLENVARLLFQHPSRDYLNHVTALAQQDLFNRGIQNVNVNYWRTPNLEISLTGQQLLDLNMPMLTLAQQLQDQLSDQSFGQQDGIFSTINVLGAQPDFNALHIGGLTVKKNHELFDLQSIASIKPSTVSDGIHIRHNGQPATLLGINRVSDNNTLTISDRLHEWLKTFKAEHPALSIKVLDEQWVYVKERLSLLLKNAGSGFLVVTTILLLFFGIRLSFWVIVCIPTCILGAVAALAMIGGTLNMISMFAFILSIGLIVDDSIVVAERIIERRDQLPPNQASEAGAKKMLKPVMASSMTTMAAFLPLLLVTGVIGTFLKEIPFVVICIIAISIIECFLVMPGHLSHVKSLKQQPHPIRVKFLQGFFALRDRYFIPICQTCCQYKGTTLTLCICFFVISCVFIASGRIGFNFFPNLSGQIIYANIEFTPNTTSEEAEHISDQIERSLSAIPNADTILENSYVAYRMHGFGQPGATVKSDNDQYAMVKANLVPIDQRDQDNYEIIEAWQKNIPKNEHIKSIMISEPGQGPTTDVITIRIFQDNLQQLTQANNYAIDWFNKKGITDIASSQGKMITQFDVEPKPAALALGLDKQQLQAQLSPALRGNTLLQKEANTGYHQVRLSMNQETQQQPSFIKNFPIFMDDRTLTLSQVADITQKQLPEMITSNQGKRSVEIVAKLNSKVINPQRIFNAFQAELQPELSNQFQASSELAGSFETQSKTLSQMKTGAIIGLSLIYIILAWTFSSWLLPIVIVSIIPFAVIGALWGHWLLGYEASLLTIFGLFALSGIVINDSIILITGFQEQLTSQSPLAGMIAAIRDRFRPVIITSLTTIGGLTPLLFETSLQAQILIPPTITIVFGLLFSLIWILVLVPVITLFFAPIMKQQIQEH